MRTNGLCRSRQWNQKQRHNSEEEEDAGSKRACWLCVQLCFRSHWTPTVSATEMEYLSPLALVHQGGFYLYFWKTFVKKKSLWAPQGQEICKCLLPLPYSLMAPEAPVITQLCVCILTWQKVIIFTFREKKDALQPCPASSCLGSVALKNFFLTKWVIFP